MRNDDKHHVKLLNYEAPDVVWTELGCWRRRVFAQPVQMETIGKNQELKSNE